MNWTEKEHEIYGGITIRQQVQEFSAVFAVSFVILADVWIYYFGLNQFAAILLAVTCVFLIFGLQRPRLVYPIWECWLLFVQVLSKFMTWVIMLLAWLLFFTPISFARKMLKINKLDLRFKAEVDTYWKKKGKKENDFTAMKKSY